MTPGENSPPLSGIICFLPRPLTDKKACNRPEVVIPEGRKLNGRQFGPRFDHALRTLGIVLRVCAGRHCLTCSITGGSPGT